MRSRLHILSFTLLLAACTGSKPMTKRAAKLDQAGMYAEAADMYLGAVQRNGRNVDAKIGLKRTAQQVLDDRLSDFFKAMAMGEDRRNAVNTFLDAMAYRDRVQRMGVVLEVPDHYRRDFEQVKGEHLMSLYEQGQARLEAQDFKGAELLFQEIARLEPNYRDASSLQAVAYLEPLYRAGIADLERGLYRKAVDEFDRILQKDKGYKDAAALRQQAIQRGQYTIAVVPFTTDMKRQDLATRLQAHVITGITASRDPFLRLVDRENMDRILEEQRLGLSGIVDEQTAVQVGNLMGAKAVIMGNLIDYREEPGQLRRSTKDAFEAYRSQEVNKETGEKFFVTRYKPVRYAEFYQENKVLLTFSFRLVSLETGEVLVSQVVERSAQDHMYYASYDGNGEGLFPARNGVVDLNDRARRDLRTLLSAPRSVRSVTTLSGELLGTVGNAVATAVQQDLKTRLP